MALSHSRADAASPPWAAGWDYSRGPEAVKGETRALWRSEPRTQRSGVSGRPPLTPLRCVRGSDGKPAPNLPTAVSGLEWLVSPVTQSRPFPVRLPALVPRSPQRLF